MVSLAPPVVESPRPFSSPGAVRVAAVTMVAAILIAYAGALTAPFILDDQGAIAENPTLHGFWASLHPPENGVPVTGRPIANLTFAINYAVSGVNVWSYHVGNLLIHALAALALFGVLRRTFARSLPANETRLSLGLAFAIALLWAVHPLQTEAVTYLSQRVESLMGLFYLCSIYCFIRYAELSPTLAKNRAAEKPAFGSAGWATLSVLACLLGMATKEVMVTAPCMILLYDWIFFRDGAAADKKGRMGYYVALMGTWLLLGALVLHAGTRGGTAGFGSGVSWWAYGLTQVWAVAHYLRLAVWPHPLLADYGRILGGSPGAVACDLAVLLPLACLSGVLLWKRSPWGYVGAWFFVVLAPSSSVVPVATEVIAERRMYLPLAAVLVAMVCAASFGVRTLARRLGWSSPAAAVGQGVLVAMVAASLMAATAARNRTYRSVLAFWSDVVEKMPGNAGAWVNVGNVLEQNGDLPGAESRYREALRLVPGYVDAHVNLANTLVRETRPEEAIEHYRDVLARYPANDAARNGLGLAAYRAGNTQMEAGHMAAAIDFYRTAVEMKPDFPDAHVNYGGALAELGRNAEAMHEFEAALKLDPNSADVHNNLGGLLAQAGRWPEARAQFEAALKLRPDYGQARDNLERVKQLQAMGARP